MEYNYVTTCLAAVSILLSVFNNCVPQQRLDGCSMTRPFLSVKGVACETKFLIRSFDVGWWLSVDSLCWDTQYVICTQHSSLSASMIGKTPINTARSTSKVVTCESPTLEESSQRESQLLPPVSTRQNDS